VLIPPIWADMNNKHTQTVCANNSKMRRITTIKELYNVLGYNEYSVDRLIDIQDTGKIPFDFPEEVPPFILDLYQIGIQKKFTCNLKYGFSKYNLDKGTLMFTEPGQTLSWKDKKMDEGYILFFHPDLLNGYELNKEINSFNFFSYNANEALSLTEKEEGRIISLLENLQSEIHHEEYSQQIVISILGLILEYSNRFYKRQFITVEQSNNYVETFKDLLKNYYKLEREMVVPNVQTFSEQLNVTPAYLSDVLRINTGKTAIEHIHTKIISEAKILLKQTDLTASEIAIKLGYDSPHYFSRLFKKKINLTPIQFRNS